MARLVSLGIIATLIIVLGITCYQVIAPFLVPLFLGAITAMLCQPLFHYFLNRLKDRRRWAAAATTVTVIGGLTLPILIGILFGVLQIVSWTYAGIEEASEVSLMDLNSETRLDVDRVRDSIFDYYNDWYLGDQVQQSDRDLLKLSDEEVKRLNENRDQLAERRKAWFDPWFEKQFVEVNGELGAVLKGLAAKTLGVVGNTVGHTIGATIGTTLHLLASLAGLVVALAVFALALFYFLADGPELILAAESLIPVDKGHQRELASQFAKTVRAVVLATFLAALGQGIATAVALKIVGVDYFFLLVIVATFASMIPMAGPFLVWFPVACWLFWTGHLGAAIFLCVVGVVVIGTLDNIIRAYVLQSDTTLHPLLAFVSVLGGLQVMGLWGVFIGPVVACCLHVLIEIFNQEVQAIPLSASLIPGLAGATVDPQLPQDEPTTAAAPAEPKTAEEPDMPSTEAHAAPKETTEGPDSKPA
jgi:predicted PurR-regulated permease PerM